MNILFDKLGIPAIPINMVPYKFSTTIVSKMLLKKIVSDRETRKYFPKALITNLSIRQLKKFIEHIKRASY
jgi:hypothetical protein